MAEYILLVLEQTFDIPLLLTFDIHSATQNIENPKVNPKNPPIFAASSIPSMRSFSVLIIFNGTFCRGPFEECFEPIPNRKEWALNMDLFNPCSQCSCHGSSVSPHVSVSFFNETFYLWANIAKLLYQPARNRNFIAN